MNTSNDMYINHFENKGQPADIPDTKIVEAYGLRKCPKLVHQIAGSDLEVRQNALAVLCEEFRNPFSIAGCADEGVIKVLAAMVTDPDFATRVRATKALALASEDAKGLSSILFDEVIPQILYGINDPAEIVRGNVYQCLESVSKVLDGRNACVVNGVTEAFVKVLVEEEDSLKATILRTINNIVGCEEGLIQAIEFTAVQTCITLLKRSLQYSKKVQATEITSKDDLNLSQYEPAVLSEAAKTLGFMCFDGRAKLKALEFGAVEQLIGLLKYKPESSSEVKSAITIALMSISITNEGKIQIYEHNGVENIIALLYDDSNIVIMNALKIIGNIAIYPKNREILLKDTTCVAKLSKLSKVENPNIAKHADIALKAVKWTP